MPTAISNNTGTLSIGKQTAKGTANNVSTYRLRYTGGFGPDEVPEIIDLVESDSSALASQNAKVGTTITGSSTHFVREDEFGLLAYMVMGANSTAGATNFTHTATHSLVAPYLTLFRTINTTTLVDKFVDCRMTSMTVTGGVGAALEATCNWGGLSAVWGGTDPVVTATATVPLTYPQVTATIGGSAPGTVQSFSITVDNNANFFRADTGMAAVDYIFGRKIVTGNLVMLFENDQEYRNFHTGTTTGTAPTATQMTPKTLNITASKGANNSVAFDMTNARWTTYAPQLGTDGAPITAAIDFSSQNLGTVAQYLTITTKNQIASY